MADIEVGNLNVKISLDESGINKSMAELNRSMRLVQSEFQAASAKLGDFGKSTEGLKLRSDSLTKQIEIQRQRVAKLAEEHARAVEEKGKDARETQNLEVRLNKAQAELAKMEAELKQVNAEIQKQSSNWYKMGQSLEDAGARLKNVGDRMSDAGRSLSMTVTAPLAAVGGLASKAAIDFESAFAGVRKTVDATEKEFAAFEKGIRDMAKNIPASAVEISKVAEAAGQLGIQKEAILGFTRTMVDLGVATNMTSEQAATSLARLANITQMSQQDFDRLGSTVVALGNNLATTESEIVEMGLRIAGAGAQIGLTEAQILAFAGALSSVGIAAEAGGSAISRVMINMANAVQEGGERLALFAKVAGMSVTDFKKAFEQDAGMAIVAFIEGLGRMSQAGENVFSVLEDLSLSEIIVRDALLRAAGAGDLFRNSLDLATEAWEENVALTKEAEQRYQTTESQLQILKNRITDIGIELGGPLLNALNQAIQRLDPFINAIARAATWFANLDPAIQTLIISFAGLLAVLGPALLIFGQITSAFGTLIKTVGSASQAIASMGGILNGVKLGFAAVISPVGIAVAAIAGLGTGVAVLVNHFKQSSIEVDLFGNKVSEATQKAVGGFLKLNDQATVALNQLDWSGQVVTQNIANNIVSTFDQMGDQVLAAMQQDHQAQLAQMQNFFAQSSALTEQEKQEALAKLQQHQQQEQQTIQQGQQRIAEILNTAKEQKRAITDAERQEINQIQQQMVETGIQYLSQNELEAKSILERMKAQAGELTAQQAAEVVQNSIKQRDEAIKAAEDQYNNVVKNIIRQRDEIGSITAEQADKLIAEAKRQRDEVVKQAEEMHHKVVEEAKKQANEHVNHIDWETGQVLSKWEAFKNGIQSKWETIKTNTKNNLIEMSSDIRNKYEEMKNTANDKFDRMKNAISEKMTTAKAKIEEIWNKAQSFLENIDLFKIGKDIIQGLLDGISSMSRAVYDKAKEIAGRVTETIRGALRISSPSKVMIEYGEWTGEGFAIGLQRSMSAIMRQAEAIATATSALGSRQTVAAGGGAVSNVYNIYLDGLFSGSTWTIRDDTDRQQLAREIAKELFHITMRASRGQGGVWR